MAEKTNFVLDGDYIPLTHADIDNIVSMYVPGGDTTGSQITDSDIRDVLEEKDISKNEEGSSVPSDIPDDYEGPISNEEVHEVVEK